MHKIILFLSLSLLALSCQAALPQAHPGTVVRHVVNSPELGRDVTVDVWLPDGYSRQANPCTVIYMHDGQNLYDPATTWNHQAWEVDSVASLMEFPPVVVGIHSVDATRISDLMPAGPIAGSGAVVPEGLPMRGEEYGRFIVNTLKPLIDIIYNVRTDAASTSVMGSSLGGLISVFLFCEYPEVFGNAAALSTHWIGFTDEAPDPAFVAAYREYLETNLPPSSSHRLYLDRGTATVDALYGDADDEMIEVCSRHGYAAEKGNFMTHVEQGAAHCEDAWRDRLHLPLKFLLGKD